MRVFFKSILFTFIIGMIWINGELLWSNRLFLNEPRIHVIREGEFLSKIAQMYYGKASYWRALALINRAPDPDRIYPGEQIILPDAGAIARVARARRLSEVNEIVSMQEQEAVLESESMLSRFIAQRQGQTSEAEQKQETAIPVAGPEPQPAAATEQEPSYPVIESESVPQPAPPASVSSESGSAGWFWPVFLGSAVLIGGVVFYFRRRRDLNQDPDDEPDEEPIWKDMEQQPSAQKTANGKRAGADKRELMLSS